jgi:hypothetical protein
MLDEELCEKLFFFFCLTDKMDQKQQIKQKNYVESPPLLVQIFQTKKKGKITWEKTIGVKILLTLLVDMA